jgi:hypothetical protein
MSEEIIRFKRGKLIDMPELSENEIVYIVDTKELCVGINGGGHKVIATGSEFATIAIIFDKGSLPKIMFKEDIRINTQVSKQKTSWWKRFWKNQFWVGEKELSV